MVAWDIFWIMVVPPCCELQEEDSELAAGGASRFLLFDADVDSSARVQETPRNHEHAPGSAIPKDPADLTLEFDGTAAKLCPELTGKRSQTPIPDLKANLGHGALRRQHLPSAIHTEPSQKIVRSLAKCGPEQAMEMEF
jgi:hypothetical protein